MRLRFSPWQSWKCVLAGAAWAALALPAARAQDGTAASAVPERVVPSPAPWHAPCPTPALPGYPAMPGYPTMPGTPGTPGTTTTPGAEVPPGAEVSAPGADTGGAETGFEPGGAPGGSGVGGNTFAAGQGYVDDAIPLSQYRLRYDAADNDNRPDRADFFYPKCGCFRALGDLTAHGPGTLPAREVNFQELANYLEIAPMPRFSVFVNAPVRWVDIFFYPTTAPMETHQGFSDLEFGGKYALVYDPDQVLTAQVRVYSPTGTAQLGLGRDHWNIEPALLYYRRLAPRLFFNAELRDFIPIDSKDNYAGNVLRYGAALSFLAYDKTTCRILPSVELVAWSVLSGRELADGNDVSAAGDFICNAKVGVRIGFGEPLGVSYLNRCDFYVGYGRALTGEVWYKDIVRAEFRVRF